MMTTKIMSAPMPNDAELVLASRAGHRGAFGQIVARYQSLVCSLAYSATGNLNRSEDLAQETFVAAWQKLPELREPPKLRAWLCGIARNLISNAQRRAGREPAHLAAPFEANAEAVATEPSPSEQAVSHEEEALLWHALEKIPATYREPLVLFYREHQSVEAVARALDLSEDAVKQRLARGRVLLHEQVLALIEGTLARTNPGARFTGAVLSALPVLGTGLATAGTAAGAGAGQGTAGAKATTWLGPLATVVTAQVLWFVGSVAFVAGAGGYVGWQMAAPSPSAAERRWCGWFWRLLAGGLLVCVLPAPMLENLARAHPSYAGLFALWLGLFYVVVGVPLVLWAIANHQRLRPAPDAPEVTAPAGDPTLRRWAAAATLGTAVMFGLGLSGSKWDERIRADQVWELIAAHPQAQLTVNESVTGGRWIAVVTTEPGNSRLHRGLLDEPTHRRLQQSGRRFATRVQGRDYDVLGWPARRLGLVTVSIIGAGVVMLMRTPRRMPRPPAPETSAPAPRPCGG